jgi:hypothetical protein
MEAHKWLYIKQMLRIVHIDNTYTVRTGSTSQDSGTSRFMVRVLDNGMLAKNAFGPFIEESMLLKSSCKSNKNLRTQRLNIMKNYL